MRSLFRGATEGRLRVSGRVHTGGTRASFAGAANGGAEPTLRVSSGTTFLARIAGLTPDQIVVQLGALPSDKIQCTVQCNTFGHEGVWVRLDAANQEELHWFWLELYLPASSAHVAAPVVAPREHPMVRRSSTAARRT